jgi:putative redox protein
VAHTTAEALAATREKLTFTGSGGHTLAARLDRPQGPPIAYALFAHCFTCGKDVAAAQRIARALAERGIAVLRFDFTGLGHSDGEFANTNFSSNVADLVAAADALRARHAAPALLIGHSLGGAAVIAAAPQVPEAKAVATIGAPADPEHVGRNFAAKLPEIEQHGEAEVDLGGRAFTIRKQFLADIAGQTLHDTLATLRKALLVLHGPRDAIVGIDNATRIFTAAKHPKSFVSLDDADHLLSRKPDALYAAQVLAAWAARYIDAPRPDPTPDLGPEPMPEGVVVQETGAGRYANRVVAGAHRMLADEPAEMGGTNTGPSPYDWLLGGLGACTSMTIRMYAERKGWPLDRVTVRLTHSKIHAEDCEDCETKSGKIDLIEREVHLVGALDDAQRQRLLEIADKCPVHRTLESENVIRTRLVDA